MKVDSIKRAWLNEGGARFDASFHLSDGLQTKRLFKKKQIKTEPLSSLTDNIFMGHRFKRYYVAKKEHGIQFLGGSDIQFSEIENVKYISKKLTTQLPNLLLNENWILVTRSGTIGKTVFTNDNFKGKAGSEDIIRIVPNIHKIYPGFLYAFLSSKYGYSLLTQGTYGAVIQHIEPHHISDLQVPIFKESVQKEIHKLIKDAANMRVEANSCLKTATSYFENRYPISNYYQKVFSKNIKDLGFSWGCKNNDIEIEEIQRKIKSEGSFNLGDNALQIYAPPLFKHIYLKKDNGNPFFTGADIIKSFRKINRFLSPRGVRNIRDYKVNQGTILVYKSGPRDGMLGSVIFTDKTLHECCLSDHVIRIVISDNKTTNWIFAFLKSKVGLRILHNLATGTAILFITPERLSAINIPLPTEDLDEISKLIDKYVWNNEKAQINEERAIKIIETEIESWQN